MTWAGRIVWEGRWVTVWKPLSARSTVLSLLLGAHPAGMSPRELTRAGEHLGISAATVRVALTRAVAAGELRRTGSDYQLGPGLLARRRRLSEQVEEPTWDGSWEMAVVVGGGRSSGDRAALRASLGGLRLAELREGVWLRPANLVRTADDHPPELRTFRVRPEGDPGALAAQLWDLRAWAAEATSTIDELAAVGDPATRLAVAAHLVRHLGTDPVLPGELCPVGWPGPWAQQVYDDYQREVRALGA